MTYSISRPLREDRRLWHRDHIVVDLRGEPLRLGRSARLRVDSEHYRSGAGAAGLGLLRQGLGAGAVLRSADQLVHPNRSIARSA